MKLDENNQYGLAMTKLMPVWSIKEKPPNLGKFSLLLKKVTWDSKIEHLFMAGIELDYENVDA